MKRLLSVLVGFALLLLSSTEGWSLPPCANTPAKSMQETQRWDNCFGTYTFPKGGKYAGEFKDGKFHGQGTQYTPDGRVKEEGMWAYGVLKSATGEHRRRVSRRCRRTRGGPRPSTQRRRFLPGRAINCRSGRVGA